MAIKVAATRAQTGIADRATASAGGLSNVPLAFSDSWVQAPRFIDVPDEVHLHTIARAEIKKRKESNRSAFAEQGCGGLG